MLPSMVHPIKIAFNRLARGERNQIVEFGSNLHDSEEDAKIQVWAWISQKDTIVSIDDLQENTRKAFEKVLYNPTDPKAKPDWLEGFYKDVANAKNVDELRERVFTKVTEILGLRLHQDQDIKACSDVLIEDIHRLTLNRRSQYEENIEGLANSEVRRTDRIKMEDNLDSLSTLFYGDAAFDRKIVAKALRNVTMLLTRDLSDPGRERTAHEVVRRSDESGQEQRHPDNGHLFHFRSYG